MGQVGRLRKPRPHACYLYTTREGRRGRVRPAIVARAKKIEREESKVSPRVRRPAHLGVYLSSTRSAPAHTVELAIRIQLVSSNCATKNQWPVNWRERTAQDEFYFWTGVRLTGPVRVRPRNASTRNYCRDVRRVRLPHGAQSVLKVGTQSRYSWMSVESPLWSVYFTRDFKL